MNITLNKKTVDSITLKLSVEEYVIIQSLIARISCEQPKVHRTTYKMYSEMCDNTGNPINSPIKPSVICVTFLEGNLQKEVERITNYEKDAEKL